MSPGLLNSMQIGRLTASPLPLCLPTFPSSKKYFLPDGISLTVPSENLCFSSYHRYNCAGLRFGKVDVGRYGEVSQRSVVLTAVGLLCGHILYIDSIHLYKQVQG